MPPNFQGESQNEAPMKVKRLDTVHSSYRLAPTGNISSTSTHWVG